MYHDARLLVLSELVLCLDVVGSGHEAAIGVTAIGRRTVNGAWLVVNTCDRIEPRIVCLVVYWMLFEYHVLRDFSS